MSWRRCQYLAFICTFSCGFFEKESFRCSGQSHHGPLHVNEGVKIRGVACRQLKHRVRIGCKILLEANDAAPFPI
jgi:hypothetical protein